MSELASAAVIAAQLCRGLTAREAGWLTMAIHPGCACAPRSGSPVALALRRGLHHRSEGLWREILTRHGEAARQAWRRTHVTWRDAISRRENPALLASLELPARDELDVWLQHTTTARLGWLDPRHRWELERGHVVELGQLPWLGADELELWLSALGLRLLAAALRRAGRRQVALLCRSLPDEHASTLIQHLNTPETLSEGAQRLCRQGTWRPTGDPARRGPSSLSRLTAMGLFGVSLMGAHRHSETLRAVAHALPMECGQALLSACQRAPVSAGMSAIGDEMIGLGLSTLQRLALRGLTRQPHHERQALVRPPAELVRDEHLEGAP